MATDTEFVNLYIEKALNEIAELNKGKLLLQTQLAWSEKTVADMSELQIKLQEANADLQAKLQAELDRKLKSKKSSSKEAQEFSEAETF